MKYKYVLFFLMIGIFSFFSCSAGFEAGEIDTGFTLVAPENSKEMCLVPRDGNEDQLLLTVKLVNSDSDEEVDSFSTTCVPEQLVSVTLKAKKGMNVYADVKFTDSKVKELVWARGKSDIYQLKNKKNLVSVNLEYEGLNIYLEQKPFKLISKKADGTVLEDGKCTLLPSDKIDFSLTNWTLFKELFKQNTCSVILNNSKLDAKLSDSGSFSVELGKAPGLLPGKNEISVSVVSTEPGNSLTYFLNFNFTVVEAPNKGPVTM